MANINLTDLTARTATADSDLIHVNSGGVDYKETKFNFLEGGFHYVFNNTSTITSQADALGSYACVFGTVSNSSSVQATLGLPLATSGRIEVRSYNANYKKIWYYPNGHTQTVYTLTKSGGTWASTWTQEPTRDEITSINSSLTNRLTPTDMSAKIEKNSGGYLKVGRIVVVNINFRTTSAITSSDVLFKLPSPSTSNQGVIPLANASTGIASGIMYVRDNGECRLYQGSSSGVTYNASGVYMADS